MTKIAQTESLELLPQELDQIVGGMSVPTNETQIIGSIIAKDFAGVFSPTPNGPHGIA
jgi:hypothetical protein